MLRLDLLGPVALTDGSNRSRNSDIPGTKPLALLVYLVLEGAHRPVRRDKVATLLWPEAEQKNARASLSQALHELKKALGDVVTARGQEELSVDRARITSDCFEFQDLATRGQLEEAVACYRGDVAAGLFVKDSVEFDDWLARQQTSWRDDYAAVLQKLCDAAIQSNDLARAAAWTEKLIDAAPEHDEPVRKLLPLLIERGQMAAAKRLYEKYERTLADTFDTAPPAEIASLIDALPQGRPRRPRATRSASLPDAPARAPRGSLTTVAAIAVVAGAVLLATQVFQLFPSKAKGAPYDASPPKVAVLPFAYAGSAQRPANVLNEALQWRLRSVGFEVLNAGSQDTTAVRKLVGSEGATGMTFVVGGDVATEGDGSVAARLWLKDAGTGKRVWESRFTQQAGDAHLIATQLSEAVATQIRRAAGSVHELAAADVAAESWKDVYHARERMEASYDMRRQGATGGSATELKDAEQTLVQVGQRERDWALPWVLRGRIAEARAFSALITGDSRQGAAELDRGIRMLDSVATRLESEDIHEMRGLLQYRRFVWGVDDTAAANRLLTRAEADLRKAFAPGRDPSGAYATLSGVMFAQGKYAEAFVYARRAYDSNVFLRNNEEVITRLFNSALHARDDASADDWCKELQHVQRGKWPAVLCRVHLAGFAPHLVDVKTLEREIEGVVAAPPIRQMMAPRLKAAYAITLAQVGETDSARATLASVAGSKDPEVMLFSAFALAALQDAPRADAALRNYLAEYRGSRSMALHMRWLNQGSQTQTPLMR